MVHPSNWRILIFLAVRFWTRRRGEGPTRHVRVLVTHEALSSIDPNMVPDADGALATFDAYHKRLYTAASSKFDEGKIADEPHEGHPLIILRDHDLTRLLAGYISQIIRPRAAAP
jgi:hypothetical protein